MLYYKADFSFKGEVEDDRKFTDILKKSTYDNYNNNREYNYFVYDYDLKKNVINTCLIFNQEKTTVKKACDSVINLLDESIDAITNVKLVSKSLTEIVALEVEERMINRCSDSHIKRMLESYAMYDYSDSPIEEIVLSKTNITYSQAVDKAHELMADKTFFDELERIYSPKNKHKFYGIPVHYMINVDSKEYANELVKLLVLALYSNQRLVSTKYSYLNLSGEDSYDLDRDVGKMLYNYYGLTSVFQLPDIHNADGGLVSRRSFDVDDLIDYFRKAHNNNLFIFVKTEDNNFSKKLLAHITKDADIIEINDSKCSKDDAMNLLKLLLKNNDIKHYKSDLTLPKQEEYTTRDICHRVAEIKRDSVKNYAYKAYKNCETVKIKVDKEETYSTKYDELQKMVGLDKVKELITQIIDFSRVNKTRKELGLDVSNNSMHMIFTGNPGSAKTTVARLLTGILHDEGIIKNGKIVECGRQDLVGKYVGWTAKAVEEKFKEARGGVLFIDEAYSLVEEHNSFGTEAINTIVQMMENYRNSVIVIFAGYPDKMKEFLDKNEGLRSRIAYHIDFPDYNSAELFDIMSLMSDEKGYIIDDEAKEKCLKIFDNACCQEEFGNGRFARNVLEQAIMKQSSRLSANSFSRKLNIDDYKTLNTDDFDVNLAELYSKPQATSIGFAC